LALDGKDSSQPSPKSEAPVTNMVVDELATSSEDIALTEFENVMFD